MNIKMIVSDLDGTLFNSDEEGYDISTELIERIDDFKKSGKIFTIATGRPEESSLEVIKKLNVDVRYIACNGAKILDRDGKTLYSNIFPLKLWVDFLEIIQEVDPTTIFYNDGQVFCMKYTDRMAIFEKKELVKSRVVDKEFLKSDLNVNKLLIIGNVEKIKGYWNKLDESFKSQYRYIISEDDYFEIVKKDISKGNALKKLKKYLGLRDDEVVSIGNHMNDKELIEESFVGVAVANAVEGLKEVADFVTEGEYEKGVIEVINKFF